jgi:hypothetical protein
MLITKNEQPTTNNLSLKLQQHAHQLQQSPFVLQQPSQLQNQRRSLPNPRRSCSPSCGLQQCF